ncbi:MULTISPECIES: M13 family metallopeptidase [Brachybacterium]|uniref:M13 family metallopeptidase n=1 Tax=Brachybacterium TaxID=43668 RepID=UPI000BB7BE5D|nr:MULTISPECIES: M13-type metalloendopeptidase [Brachybacterium]PCC35011.1 peptidase M13 [Brachybacterium alimentarium]RCS65010.1 peptidase M13 [Brachybacterium sp. JB7]RCS83058.1 peptidase M13 [Brachybacterium alimentarium]
MTAAPTDTARSGLRLTEVDPDIRLQDDLFGHVNGRWLDTHEIPADRSSDGAFHRLRDLSEERVREIIEEAAADITDPSAVPTTDHARVGMLYRMFMDTEAIEASGLAPLEDLLAPISESADLDALVRTMAAPDSGASALLAYVWTDDHDSTSYQVKIHQGGLGLPDESYYREEDYAEIRSAYVTHLANMARLADLPGRPGLRGEDAEGLAAAVMDFETRLAACHADVVRLRDREKSYNPMDAAQRRELAPQFPWDAYIEGTGAPAKAFEVVSVGQPEFVSAAAELLAAEDLDVLRSWLALHTVGSYAPYLPAALVDEDFAFSGRVLSGAEELRERWKRGVGFVEGVAGFAVGREYVSRHFPPAHKERMTVLVDALMDAYRSSIQSLEWMTPATRDKALAKLEKFTPKIGYPDEWRDYEGLDVVPGDLVATVRSARRFDADFEYAKVGGPIDEHEWHMSPQTVNAYYNPGRNEIVFPAAILQPPFFDAEAEDAVNFGGIGAVIGHEVGHGFDDQGSKYDGDGNLASWWTIEDREAFDERAARLITQYSQLSPRELEDTHRVNGALTIGENIGDLGGLSIAVKAYRGSRTPEQAAAELDGFTGLQRVFLSWATVWRGKNRIQEAIRRLAVDPHAPMEFRCNTVVGNLQEFHDAFDVREGDGMYRAPEDRVTIW